MKLLANLAKVALAGLGEPLTFGIKDVKTKASKTGNVGFQATCTNGQVITFWKSTMDAVIQNVEGKEDQFEVIPGTQITTEGSLIPSGSASNGFWAD